MQAIKGVCATSNTFLDHPIEDWRRIEISFGTTYSWSFPFFQLQEKYGKSRDVYKIALCIITLHDVLDSCRLIYC